MPSAPSMQHLKYDVFNSILQKRATPDFSVKPMDGLHPYYMLAQTLNGIGN